MKRSISPWLAGLAAVMLSAGMLKAAFIPESVNGNLVQLVNGEVQPVTPNQEAQLDRVKLFALYFSAHWCPPCRKFTPELVEFYQQVKKEHPNFEIIFVSNDRSPEALTDYIRTASMPWPAVVFGKGSELERIYSGEGIPRLVLVDQEGKVLADSYEGDRYVGPRRVLQEIRKRLKSAPDASVPAPSPVP